MYYYDEWRGRWRLVGKGEAEGGRVVVETRHFTDMVAAVLKVPEGVEPLEVDINAVKGVGVGEVEGGVVEVGVGGVGGMGWEGVRVPLWVPEGRRGMRPELEVRYVGKGWGNVGEGWWLKVGEVKRSDRWGVPRYEGGDRIELEGEELVEVGGGEWRRRREGGGYEEVEYYDQRDEWEVRRKDGVVVRYGGNGGKVEGGGGTYIWYKSKEEDAYGNRVEWLYERDEWGGVYLAEVRYVGWGAEEGAYRVEVEWEGRGDVRVDGRGGKGVKWAKRLKEVVVEVEGEEVVRYWCEYEENVFGASELKAVVVGRGGEEWYRYEMGYEGLTDVDGDGAYEGFVEEEWGGVGEGVGGRVTERWSWGMGMDLTVEAVLYGLKWKPLWEIERTPVASVGASMGFSVGGGWVEQAVVDINGDGKVDVVRVGRGGVLEVWYNTGGGFEGPHEDAGVGSGIGDEDQWEMSVGAWAGVGPVNVGGLWSWGKTRRGSGFVDVDGDGLVDIVEAGRGEYWKNTGGGFERRALEGEVGGEEGGGEEGKVYYWEEVVRKWEVLRSGVVEVRVGVEEVEPEVGGVVGEVWKRGKRGVEKVGEVGVGEELVKEVRVEVGEELVWAVVVKGEEVPVGVKVKVPIEVRYRKVKLYEDVGWRGEEYVAPVGWQEWMGSYEDEKNPWLKVYQVVRDDEGTVVGVVRRGNWEEGLREIVEGDKGEEVRAGLREHLWVIPKEVRFVEMKEVVESYGDEEVTVKEAGGGEVDVKKGAYMMACYAYEEGRATMAYREGEEEVVVVGEDGNEVRCELDPDVVVRLWREWYGGQVEKLKAVVGYRIGDGYEWRWVEEEGGRKYVGYGGRYGEENGKWDGGEGDEGGGRLVVAEGEWGKVWVEEEGGRWKGYEERGGEVEELGEVGVRRGDGWVEVEIERGGWSEAYRWEGEGGAVPIEEGAYEALLWEEVGGGEVWGGGVRSFRRRCMSS
ncbi:FG-GAP repeat domain-containing protein [Spirochaeta thermophila]|uniref:FG-GAP repeat protein n=1 Tax=Winmispira thermophila (strain ATCC 49972 / DSM 6192 / RI 19.B1) TaxID=665571 RepID=E0RTY1_WINT6|nr:VCBS repeat-containing protein [Spirochaeta thermophila]ADN01037.1 hypothetical protein STHERM_c00610 [Spirochaeta thermophila DSM 6192]